MLRITFPYILLISLTALAGGILNTFESFLVPALTPVLLNVSLILCAVLFGWWGFRRFGPPKPAADAPRRSIVEHAEALIAKMAIKKDRYEFQMLLGVDPELPRRICHQPIDRIRRPLVAGGEGPQVVDGVTPEVDANRLVPLGRKLRAPSLLGILTPDSGSVETCGLNPTSQRRLSHRASRRRRRARRRGTRPAR